MSWRLKIVPPSSRPRLVRKPCGTGTGVLEQLFPCCPLPAGLRPRGGHSTLSCPNKLPLTDELPFSDPLTASLGPLPATAWPSWGSSFGAGILFFFKIYLFIYFWLHWVFVAARGLSLVAASGGYSSLWCAGFSLWWLLLLWSTGSRHVGFSSCGSQALERRLSSWGTRAQLLRGMWDLPGPGQGSNPCLLH